MTRNGKSLIFAVALTSAFNPNVAAPQNGQFVLALHFGVGGGDAVGAGGDVVRILIGPALAELGAVIVAPDSVRGDWSSPENEKAVNALLDMAAHPSLGPDLRVQIIG